MRKFIFCLLAAIVIKASLPLFALSFNDEGSPAELAAAIETAMTDEQALAQVLMFGWLGEEPSPLILSWIRQRNIGGVKIFGWNTADTMKLARTVGELQKASLSGPFNIPLLVATDQEGGLVRHVKGSTRETPGNMAIGASGYPRDAYLAGYYIGKELALIGVNLNFAPTIDLFTNKESTLIGPRAFGSDPVRAGVLGTAFMKGQLAAGIIPTAKHFPGHGDTGLDSHSTLPRINIPYQTLWDRELVPYRMLVTEGLPVVMSSHLAFPLIQNANIPASLSSWFLRDVLRDRIGFKGVVITDDLMMAGATVSTASYPRTAKQALAAGNDIILFSSTPALNDSIWTFLVNSMRDESDFRKIIRSAARRTLELKLTYLRGSSSVPYIPDLEKIEKELDSSQASDFFLELAARSATIVNPAKSSDVFPLTRENSGRVLLMGRFTEFFTYGRAAFPNASIYRYPVPADSSQINYFASNADTIIFCLSSEVELRVLRGLERLNKKVIVLSVLNPAFLENAPWVTGAVAVYSYAPESFAAGFSAITGRIPAHGTLPYE